MFISLIIPARNECEHIDEAVKRCVAELRDLQQSFEVIVVDDHSSDNTFAQAQQLQDQYPELRVLRGSLGSGKGAAVLFGILESEGTHVAYLDADLEYDPHELIRMIRLNDPIGPQGPAIVATRVGDSRPQLELITSKIARWVIKMLFGLGISDTQAGLKLLPGAPSRRAAALTKEFGWLFDVELLWWLKVEGIALVEHKLCQKPIRRRRVGLFGIVMGFVLALKVAGRVRLAPYYSGSVIVSRVLNSKK